MYNLCTSCLSGSVLVIVCQMKLALFSLKLSGAVELSSGCTVLRYTGKSIQAITVRSGGTLQSAILQPDSLGSSSMWNLALQAQLLVCCPIVTWL